MRLTPLLCFLLGMSSGYMDDVVGRVKRMSLALHVTYMGGKGNVYVVLMSEHDRKRPP